MTNTGGAPPGWYHAEGDPEGTQRYWDGRQWIGDPQVVPAPQPPPTPPQQPSDPDQTVVFRPGAAAAGGDGPGSGSPAAGFDPPTPGAAPDYSSPGSPPAASSAPNDTASSVPNYTAAGSGPGGYQNPVGQATPAGPPAEWGTRAVAWLIDIAPVAAVYVVMIVAGWINDVLGVLVFIVGAIAILGYSIWNFYVTQGATGQTIGKEKQGIKLVKDETGRPVGGGMAFVRYLIIGALSVPTCGLYFLLDILWPLWDADRKRLTDKMLKMSVVTA